MAGDWIPMRMDLAHDPAVIAVSSALDVPEDHVVGMLHRLWSWANEELENGHAPSVTKKWLDRYVQRDGFASALEKCGWLLVDSDGSIAIPKFDSWNSKSAKRRLLSAKRQKRQRSVCHADVTKTSRSKRDKSVTREEKRREEKKDPLTPLTPSSLTVSLPAGLDTPRFRDAWRAWLAHRVQKKKPATAEAQAMALKKLSGWGEARAIAAIEHSVSNGWDGVFEPQGGVGPAAKAPHGFHKGAAMDDYAGRMLLDVIPQNGGSQ